MIAPLKIAALGCFVIITRVLKSSCMFIGETTVSGESAGSWQSAFNLNQIALATDNYRYHETREALAVKCLCVRLPWKERSCVLSACS